MCRPRVRNQQLCAKLCLVFIACVFVFGLPSAVGAQGFAATQVGNTSSDALGVQAVGNATGLTATDPRVIAARIINVSLGVLGVIVVVLMLYAGYMWMTAGGDEEKIATAKKILQNAVIGLVIILSAMGIVTFIINKLTAATTGSSGASGGTGDNCVGINCAFGGGGNIFYATTTPQGKLLIKNVGITVLFFNGLGGPAPVDSSTIPADTSAALKSIKIVKEGTQDEPAGAFTVSADKTRVDFLPSGSCADAAFPNDAVLNAHNDCLEKNTTYRVILTTDIKSANGLPLRCDDTYPCESTLTTGDRYDLTPPAVNMVQPGDGAIVGDCTNPDFPVCYSTPTSAAFTDDAGVKSVSFYETPPNSQPTNLKNVIPTGYPLLGVAAFEWKPTLTTPAHAQIVQLSAKASDVDSHETTSAPQNVKIVPAWCFDNKLEDAPPYNEEQSSTVLGAPDCGAQSECGACQGEGCDANLDCASGYCYIQAGVKVALTDDHTRYQAFPVALPQGKLVPYYEWYFNGTPLLAAYLPFDQTKDPAKLTSNVSNPQGATVPSAVSQGTVHGAVWQKTDGIIGAAYEFSHPQDYIEAPTAPWKGNQVSVEWWMNRPAGAQLLKIFQIVQVNGSFGIQTDAQGNVTVSAQASDDPSAKILEQGGGWPLPSADGAWHQVALVFDGSHINYFVDGNLTGSSVSFPHVLNATTNPLVVGYKANAPPGTEVFNGLIDEVKLYQIIVTPQQLKAEYAAETKNHTPYDMMDIAMVPYQATVTADAWPLAGDVTQQNYYQLLNNKVLYEQKSGVCLNVPKITQVVQSHGAPGNYVTLIGQSFGAYNAAMSKVYFNTSNDPQKPNWQTAELCDATNPQNAWHDTYVVAKVPFNAHTGPVRIGAVVTLNGQQVGVYDGTNDNFGPVFDPTQVFKVTDERFPGLCAIDPQALFAGEKFTVSGTQLGNGAADGDAIQLGAEKIALTQFDTWNNVLIGNIATPATLGPGITNVIVHTSGFDTNALPLGIKSSAEDTSPHIQSMTPVKGPVGTYVTIVGKNFGADGKVMFTKGGDSWTADLPPAYCTNTWDSTRIVRKVPADLLNTPGEYAVSVVTQKNGKEFTSDTRTFTVNTDPLAPGLCQMTPDNGPLFSPSFGGITFKGEGFGNTPGAVDFYNGKTNGATVKDVFITGWTADQVGITNLSTLTANQQKTFKTGPVEVNPGAAGGASNPLNFKIQDCQAEIKKGNDAAAVCGAGNTCCVSGSCAPSGQCPEDQKPGASVYEWSFTTGKLPVVPHVIEQCGSFCAVSGTACTKDADCNITKDPADTCLPVTPSPTPSAQWQNENGICVNASVAVRFDTAITTDPQSAASQVIVYTCADQKKCALTDAAQIVPVIYTIGTWQSGVGSGAKLEALTQQDLQPNQSYGIVVTTQVTSKADALSQAMPENPLCPAIGATVSAGGVKGLTTAYCTTFTTRNSTDHCELGSVVVDPTVYTAQDFNHIYSKLYSATPLAKGNVCITLNAQNYDWAWSPTNEEAFNSLQKKSVYAALTNTPGANKLHAPVQDAMTKDVETPANNPESILAIWNDSVLNPLGVIHGTAHLTVKLPNPKVIAFWPNCTTACMNAQIAAQFNVAMDPHLTVDVVQFSQCVDTLCTQLKQFSSNEYGIYTGASVPNGVMDEIVIKPINDLASNTYYKVVIQGGSQGVKSQHNIALAADSLNDGCDADGKNCTQFFWTFRTKPNASACSIDKVVLNPQTATVRVVGAVAPFTAVPLGAPDECSPTGQILNTAPADGYNWNWVPPQSADPLKDQNRAVLWVSNYSSGAQSVPWCSSSCVLTGSNLAPAAGLCGNGKVDSGEECDPSLNDKGNNTPATCGWNCLLYVPENKGTASCNADTIAKGNCCGNGPAVLPEAGEECDFGAQNGVAGSGCTASCLKEGTAISYAACVAPAPQGLELKPADCQTGAVTYQHNGQTIHVSVRSVCGNKVTEAGEECDNGAPSPGHENDKGNLNGQIGSSCSSTCVLQLVDFSKCGDGMVDIKNGEECDPGDPATGAGCSATCQKLGASPLYGSLCGDGTVGAGESCDMPGGAQANYVRESQYATAVGLGAIDPTTKSQTAALSATVFQNKQNLKTGTGSFVLACGFAPPDSACPDPKDPANAANGVGTDTCCYPRPTVAITKPSVPSNVCPNALLSVTMTGQKGLHIGEADTSTVDGNIILAQAVKVPDGATACPAPYAPNPFAYETRTRVPHGWWQTLIASVTRFFGVPAHADTVLFCGGQTPISTSVSYDKDNDMSTIAVSPLTPLAASSEYKLFVLNYNHDAGWQGLANTLGMHFNSGAQSSIVSDFTTAKSLCKADSVAISPDFHLFQDTKTLQDFTVQVYHSAAGVPGVDAKQELTPIKDVYDWNYVWNTGNEKIVKLPIQKDNGKTVSAQAVANGEATITGAVNINDQTPDAPKNATAPSLTATALAEVFVCDNPWPSAQSYNDPVSLTPYGIGFMDADTTLAKTVQEGSLQKGKAWNYFKIVYCRDAGTVGNTTDDLPALNPPAVLYHTNLPPPAPPDPILKEFFFTFDAASNNKDSIGLRIYPNTKHLPLMEWYQSQPWIPKGTPVPAKVGTYDALQEGRTWYIEGLNLNSDTVPVSGDGSNTTAYTNVYVWSYSDSASQDTANIFTQLLNNFVLNINVNEQDTCADNTKVNCKSDLDCTAAADAGAVCIAPLEKATRDLKRIKDLSALSNVLATYNTLKGAYPNLKNNPTLGTFIPGLTTSKWLSWQGVLGNALQSALPVDPLNQFNGCGSGALKDFDSATCWNASNSTYECPTGSYIYQYAFTSSTKAVMQAHFELPQLKWNQSLEDIAGTNSSVLDVNGSGFCANTPQGVQGTCGDGIVGVNEQCEIGQVQEFSCLDTQNKPVDWAWLGSGLHYVKHRFVPCDNTCHFASEQTFTEKRCKTTMKVCTQDSDCNPATSGECSYYIISAQGTSFTSDKTKATPVVCVPIGYCGDGIIQNNTQSGPRELCDDGPLNGTYGHCSIDCKSTTSAPGYCGDGQLKVDGKGNPADPNKVCDASALLYNSNTNKWTYNSGVQGSGWQTDNNLLACSKQTQGDTTCLLKGAKYNPDKLQSCSWDCQSFDYCGDGKVNSTLKADGTPYEECDKGSNPYCTVGFCKKQDGTLYIDTSYTNGKLCESNTDCAALVKPVCDVNQNICTHSADNTKKCTVDADCDPIYTCQNQVAGKRYCVVTGEPKPLWNAATKGYEDDTQTSYADTTKTCQWANPSAGAPFPGNSAATCFPLATPPTPPTGACGDGIINDGMDTKGKLGSAIGPFAAGHGPVLQGAAPEVCDQGNTQNGNGTICTADYGKTCNYCSFGCNQVVTVSGGFCGDGVVTDTFEYCDASATASDYVCEGTSNACNPKDNTPCAGNVKCVPSAKWSQSAIDACTGSNAKAPAGSFLTNCTNTCAGSCKVPVCGDGVVDQGEKCDNGDIAHGVKNGTNGIVPQLKYSVTKQTQDYCDTDCNIQTAVSEYCGDKILNGKEECEQLSAGPPASFAFSDGGKKTCASPSVPICAPANCTVSCLAAPDITLVDLKGTSSTSVIVKVVDADGVYNPAVPANQKQFSITWNGTQVVTLNAANNYEIKLTHLTQLAGNSSAGGNLGITFKQNDGSNSDLYGYVAIYSSFQNPESTDVTAAPTWQGWGKSTPDNAGVYVQSDVSVFIKIQ